MIRAFAALALAVLVAGCGPAAPQDATAYFDKTGGTPFAVEAAANGDARVVAGDETYIRAGGVDYVVLQDSRGSFVAREADLLALLGERAAPPRPQPDYAASAGGQESVAGTTGTVWRIHPAETPSITSVDAVVSGDPALAGIGRGLAAYVRVLIAHNSRTMGAPGNLERAMAALLDKGAVLRFGTVIRLVRIETAPIPPDHFRLPAAPLEKAALEARLEA